MLRLYLIIFQDTQVTEGVSPCICNFGTRWKLLVNSRLQLLYYQKRDHSTHCLGDWVVPEPVWMLWRREKSLAPILQPSCTNPIAILTELHLPLFVLGYW
jgi:hypothetical protein